MHLLQNWCLLSSFKQQKGRGFLNKMYILMHSFKMWRATNKLNYSSELFETKWKAVPLDAYKQIRLFFCGLKPYFFGISV